MIHSLLFQRNARSVNALRNPAPGDLQFAGLHCFIFPIALWLQVYCYARFQNAA